MQFLNHLFSEKPELIIPELPIDEVKEYRKIVVAEIAGRDSVGAVIKAQLESDFDAVLPTVVYTGTEFGEIQTVLRAVEEIKLRIGDIKVFPLLALGSPKYWWVLNGRFITELFHKFGFYSSCIGCHLYLHSVRIPLTRKLNCKVIVAGERESHGGRIKLNQTSLTLDYYVRLLSKFGIELYLPLRNVASENEMGSLVGDWNEEERQLSCVLSRNYVDICGNTIFKDEGMIKYMERFALPLAEKVISAFLAGETPEYESLGRHLLENQKV